MGTAASFLDAPRTCGQDYQTGDQVSEVAPSGLPFCVAEVGEHGHAARPALGNVELCSGFFSPLGAEIVVGGRDVAYQAVNEVRRGDFVGGVGWAVVGEEFTVGLAVFRS